MKIDNNSNKPFLNLYLQKQTENNDKKKNSNVNKTISFKNNYKKNINDKPQEYIFAKTWFRDENLSFMTKLTIVYASTLALMRVVNGPSIFKNYPLKKIPKELLFGKDAFDSPESTSATLTLMGCLLVTGFLALNACKNYIKEKFNIKPKINEDIT